MHRYHFHAYGPNRRIPGECGDYLDDMMVVRDLAFATIRDIVSDPLGPADYRRWRIEVEDEDGRTILVVPFRSALAVPARPSRPHPGAGMADLAGRPAPA